MKTVQDPQEQVSDCVSVYVLKNGVALSDAFHTDKRYGEFYDRYRDQLSGFIGIWKMLMLAAVVLEESVQASQFTWDDEYYDVILGLVNAIYTEALKHQQAVQCRKFLRPLVDEQIARAVLNG